MSSINSTQIILLVLICVLIYLMFNSETGRKMLYGKHNASNSESESNTETFCGDSCDSGCNKEPDEWTLNEDADNPEYRKAKRERRGKRRRIEEQVDDYEKNAADDDESLLGFDSEFENMENSKTIEKLTPKPRDDRLLPSYDTMKGTEHFESDFAPVSRSLEYNEPVYDTFNAPQTDPYAGEDFYEHGYSSLMALNEGFKDCPPETVRVFFGEDNMKRIQKKIRREVFKRSYGKFKLKVDQNVNHLIIAMIAIVRLHAKFLPTKVIRQVKRLNEETVQYIVPDLMTNLKQQYSYIQDITNPIQPLPDPINVNQAGRNQLRSVTAVWNI
jgi:Family of unknown function (DUF5761)